MKRIVIALLILSSFSCEKKESSIEGLWTVKSVMVGKEEMTPNARWMRFNADSTQESGNGWFQHSIGKWKLLNNELVITNSNGLIDPFQPFKIDLQENRMSWKRVEDGENIEVRLERATHLPLTYGDQILGLWKLEQAVGKGDYFSETSTDYLFFRWDKRFVVGNDSNRITGVYQVNGHRPIVELFPSSKGLERKRWEIQFEENAITLNQLNADSTVTRTFKRIHEFPK